MKIYFDMDGVLADFDKGIEELDGVEAVDQASRDEERTSHMWNAVKEKEHFYLHLSPIKEGLDLFQELYDARPQDIEILSAQPAARRNILTAEQDKRDWCQKYLPKIPVNITYRREKINFAKGNILIDDYQNNIDAWEEAGGMGILFTGKDDVLRKLRDLNVL